MPFSLSFHCPVSRGQGSPSSCRRIIEASVSCLFARTTRRFPTFEGKRRLETAENHFIVYKMESFLWLPMSAGAACTRGAPARNGGRKTCTESKKLSLVSGRKKLSLCVYTAGVKHARSPRSSSLHCPPSRCPSSNPLPRAIRRAGPTGRPAPRRGRRGGGPAAGLEAGAGRRPVAWRGQLFLYGPKKL